MWSWTENKRAGHRRDGDPAGPGVAESDGPGAERPAAGRGPEAAKVAAKRLISLRLDAEVIEHFRATGPGWQTRMNDALRRAAGL